MPQHPQKDLPRSPVAMDRDRKSPFIICMAWSNYRDRKAFFSIFFHKKLFTCDLITRILPIRISQSSPLCNPVVSSRLMICRCRTDINVLIRYIFKQSIISFHLLGLTNPLVFPAPEPPTISMFLFLSYLGWLGRVMRSHSEAVRGILNH